MKDDEEKAWLMGTSKPAEGKSCEAYNPPASPGLFTRLGFTKKRVIVGAIVIISLWFVYNAYNSMGSTTMDFVHAEGEKFIADCRPFYPAGVNTHDLMQAALMTTYDFNMKKSGRARIRDMMRQASGAGLNMIRTWSHTNHKRFPFQEEPGVYDENAFKALDYILNEARKHGIRVILSFVDNWKYYNGVDQYVDWSDTTPKRGKNHIRPEDKDGDPTPLAFDNEEIKTYEVARHSLFYTDEHVKQLYKDHVKAIINRKNHLNGMRYKDDPTIFSWDLLNEPRCESYVIEDCPKFLQKWIEEMAAYVKQEDPKHMVTIGSEGFYSKDSPHDVDNPQNWAKYMGQDWVGNHLSPNIDFATIHVWPDNWERPEKGFQTEWMKSHINASAEIGKPLLFEEFGKKLVGDKADDPRSMRQTRDPVYHETYSAIEEAMAEGKNVQGSLFWRWNMPLFSHMGRGDYGVRPEDSTFEYVIRHARFINSLTNSRPPAQECEAQCWVPSSTSWSRTCSNKPAICEGYWNNPSTRHTNFKVYPTQLACCRPGQGAFEEGCSWGL